MDIVENLLTHAGESELNAEAALEIEHLRAENEILRTAFACADVAMAGAPIWHSQDRVLSDILAAVKKTLAELESAAEES